jgi:hypothetical protein
MTNAVKPSSTENRHKNAYPHCFGDNPWFGSVFTQLNRTESLAFQTSATIQCLLGTRISAKYDGCQTPIPGATMSFRDTYIMHPQTIPPKGRLKGTAYDWIALTISRLD